MPINVVKTKRDEELWEKAKRVVRNEYGSQKKIGKEKFYKLVMGTYKKMKGGKV